MDQGHDNKRPRLSTGPWPAGPSHHGHGPLPHPGTPLTAAHPPAPPPPSQYQPFHRPPEPPPPPPPQHFDDRRQHESGPYPPMQDRPPPSPAHPHYPEYPPRDPIVKRDPGEDATLPQLRRPNSTGNAPELPIPPGTPHGPLPQAHMEDRRHMSFDNGPPPPMYRHPSYPPPTPVQQHPAPYEPSMYHQASGGPDGLYPIAYATTGKRKAQRASQACDSCRQLKAKCDELKPCKSCKEKGFECKYRDPVPKQQDKATADILDGITSLREMMSDGLRGVEQRLGQRLAVVENAFRSINPSLAIGAPPLNEDAHRRYAEVVSPVPAEGEGEDAFSSSPGDLTTVAEPPIDPSEAAQTMRQMAMDEDVDMAPGQPVPPGKPAMPADHTTPAGFLLTWPSIREMLDPHLQAENIKYVEDYPRRLELKRGQLSLFGRGEGHDMRLIDKDGNTDQGDIPDDVSVSDYPSSPSQTTDWGSIGGMTPPGVPTTDFRNTVLKSDGSLDFDESRVWKYLGNYEQHIQNMHPIFIPKELRAMVRTFLDNIAASRPAKTATFAKFAQAEPSPPIDNEKKRKRSPGPEGSGQLPPHGKRSKPQRSIQTALVLLVLALGKICGHRDRRLPDVGEPDIPATQGSPVVRNGHASSPNQTSPPSGSLSHSSGLPSPKEHDRMLPSRRSSFQGNASSSYAPTSAVLPSPTRKNYESIPGLEYFAFATDILGNQFGGTTLMHVHAHILACLYYGQLGRVVASYQHIKHASSTLMIHISGSLDRLQKALPRFAVGKHDNKIAFAFWSCLQLESDILAELNLHPSGLLAYEENIPWPDASWVIKEFELSEGVVHSYLAQLYLRKRLNDIHGLLYDPAKQKAMMVDVPEDTSIIDHIEQVLLHEMSWLHPSYQFSPDDPPSKDILAARIRAKFWGAQNITYRPFIRQILYFSYNRRNIQQSPQAVPGDISNDGSVPHINPSARNPNDIHPSILEYAKNGINALLKSTEAFHNLEDRRFIITNVFGTAHAQWGNLITLAAVFRDPILTQFLDEGKLRELFRRTIDFLGVVASSTSSIAVDRRILQNLERDLWGDPIDPRTTSSFSSQTSGGPPMTPAGPMPPGMPAPSTPADGFAHPGHMQM